MEKIIFEHLIEYNSSVKKSTILKYVRNIINLKKFLQYTPDNLDFLKDYQSILEVLNNKDRDYSIQTKNSYIVAVLQTIKAFKFENSLIDFYSSKVKEYNTIIKSNYLNQSKSKKQQANWVDWMTLIKFYVKYRRKVRKMRLTKKKDLTKAEYNKVMNMVILSCYFSNYKENPPRRNIYASLYIYRIKKKEDYELLDKKKNYLIIKNSRVKYFLFNDYKTVKNYGSIRIKINKELNNDINLWLRFNKTKFFMPSVKKNRVMTTGEFTKRLKDIMFKGTKKNISSQMIRNILLSYIHRDTPKIRFLTNLSVKMGHSLSMGLINYSKKTVNSSSSDEDIK